MGHRLVHQDKFVVLFWLFYDTYLPKTCLLREEICAVGTLMKVIVIYVVIFSYHRSLLLQDLL